MATGRRSPPDRPEPRPPRAHRARPEVLDFASRTPHVEPRQGRRFSVVKLAVGAVIFVSLAAATYISLQSAGARRSTSPRSQAAARASPPQELASSAATLAAQPAFPDITATDAAVPEPAAATAARLPAPPPVSALVLPPGADDPMIAPPGTKPAPGRSGSPVLIFDAGPSPAASESPSGDGPDDDVVPEISAAGASASSRLPSTARAQLSADRRPA